MYIAESWAIAACPTLERAFSAAEYIEECAQLAYWSMMAGSMNPIPDEAVKELHDRMLKGIAGLIKRRSDYYGREL